MSGTEQELTRGEQQNLKTEETITALGRANSPFKGHEKHQYKGHGSPG